MKIAVIVERFPPDTGGSGVRYQEVTRRLGKRHEIDIFTIGSAGICGTTNGPNVHRFGARDLSIPYLRGINRVAVLSISVFLSLLFHSYDVIDIDFWPIVPFFSTRFAKPSTPTVVSWNVAWPFSFYKPASIISEALAHVVSRMSTHNVTVSHHAKRSMIEHLNVAENRVDVIPNGVEEAFSNAHLQSQWGRMVFVGRLEPQKRLDLLISSLEILKQRHEEVELHIIGSGPLESEILRFSKKVEGLFLHDPIPRERVGELISELSRSWVFVSASEFEAFGMSVAEAFQIGLPAILTQTSNNAAVGELAISGHNCLIVEHNNPEAIAKAVGKLYENEKLWKKLSYNAKHSTPILSWDEIATRTEAVYERFARSHN